MGLYNHLDRSGDGCMYRCIRPDANAYYFTVRVTTMRLILSSLFSPGTESKWATPRYLIQLAAFSGVRGRVMGMPICFSSVLTHPHATANQCRAASHVVPTSPGIDRVVSATGAMGSPVVPDHWSLPRGRSVDRGCHALPARQNHQTPSDFL